jgi:hypothetical protein
MADEQTTTANPEGVTRTAEGAIADLSPGAQTTTTETKPETKPEEGTTLLTEGEKKPDAAKPEEKKPETKTEPGKVPDKYEDYKVPEGFNIAPEVKTKADALFKDLGLDQAGAQKAVDFYRSLAQEREQADAKDYKDTIDSWRRDAEADPDLRGKLGPGKEINVRFSKALDSLGDPALANEFKSAMNTTGAGNIKSFIKVFDALAQRVTEGSHVAGNGPSKLGQSEPGSRTQPTAAGALWPNLKSSNP